MKHNVRESGRSHLANADKVFERILGVSPPAKNDRLPIFSEDTLPKDLFFPMGEEGARAAFAALPASESRGVTHVWLRRPRASEFRTGRIPLAEYVAYDEFAIIALYPWPQTLRMPLVKKMPDQILGRYRAWAPRHSSHKGKWHLEWSRENAEKYFQSELMREMVAIHTDFRAKHALREAKRGEAVPIVYANQKYFEEHWVIY